MTKKDIAIIGGTFNPVHNGHTAMADYLSKNYITDEVWMLPSYYSPHKDIDTKKSFDDRVKMLKLALNLNKNIQISLFEKDYYERTKKVTYTSDILKDIKSKILNIDIHIVLGFDSLKKIYTWHDYEYLIENFEFYIFDRKDDEFKNINEKKEYIKNLSKKIKKKIKFEFFDYQVPDISSTKIREALKDVNNNLNFLNNSLNKNVLNYIVNNNMYL